MDSTIEQLDERTAVVILARIAASRLPSGSKPEGLSRHQREALRAAFSEPLSPNPATEGELARLALQVLAEDDSQVRDAIHTMAAHPMEGKQQFELGTTIAVTTAVLLVLQTQVEFERDKDGRWSVKIKKLPTKEKLLQPLVAKLLALLPKGE